jgi:hypothetical protein
MTEPAADAPPPPRPSKFAAFVFVFSLIAPGILTCSIVWPIVFKPDFGVASVIGVMCPWAGALALSCFAVVLSFVALLRAWWKPELRGRAMGASALAMSVGGSAVGILPLVALLLAIVGAIIALGVAIMGIMSVGVSGRPLGQPATTRAHLFASSKAIWRARAWDEARSIDAFHMVARDLQLLGAPQSLVNRAHDAAADEARHADIAAQRAGGASLPDRCQLPAPVDRETFVRQTILEGCIGEAFAAAVLAEEGEDEIAQDEQRHAQLAWDIVDWAGPVPVQIPAISTVPSTQVSLVRQFAIYRRIRKQALMRLASAPATGRGIHPEIA